MISQDTIVALATPSGAGAIAIIRISGKDAITIAAKVFTSPKGKDITKQKSHTNKKSRFFRDFLFYFFAFASCIATD